MADTPHGLLSKMDPRSPERGGTRRPHTNLVDRHARARFVVLGVEVGGRFFTETQSFLSEVARAKARCENSISSKRVEQAWRLRWGSLLPCTTARAVASSLLGLPNARGADGDTRLETHHDRHPHFHVGFFFQKRTEEVEVKCQSAPRQEGHTMPFTVGRIWPANR